METTLETAEGSQGLGLGSKGTVNLSLIQKETEEQGTVGAQARRRVPGDPSSFPFCSLDKHTDRLRMEQIFCSNLYFPQPSGNLTAD